MGLADLITSQFVKVEHLNPDADNADKEGYVSDLNLQNVSCNIQPISAELNILNGGAFGNAFTMFTTASGILHADRLTLVGSDNQTQYIVKGSKYFNYEELQHLELLVEEIQETPQAPVPPPIPGHTTSLYGKPALSFVFSIKHNLPSMQDAELWAWGDGISNSKLTFDLDTDNHLVVTMDGGGSVISVTTFDPATIYRIGISIDKQIVKIYVGGILDTFGSFTSVYSFRDALPIFFGYNPVVSGKNYIGDTDEWVAFSEVKDATFFATDYNLGTVLPYTPNATIIGLYHFDNNLVDSSTTSLNLTGGATFTFSLISG